MNDLPTRNPAQRLRDQILGAKDITREPVTVPEWGVTVYVQELTGADADLLSQKYTEAKQSSQIGANQTFTDNLLLLTLVDGEGQRIFGDEDLAAMKGKSAEVLKALVKVAMRVNRFDKDTQDAAVGNSDAAPTA